MSNKARRGQLFIISAPSGVGKTTIIRSLLAEHPEIRYSVSCTTRAPRSGETAGVDYQFLAEEEFVDGIRSGRFLEWARVHGNYYGTDGTQIDAWLTDGDDVFLDIDVQGARQVRLVHRDAQTIFILPPSMHILEERLKNRGTESPEQHAIRMAAAAREIFDAPWYDFTIVNDTLEEAIADLKAIVRTSRCRPAAQIAVIGLLLSPGSTSNV